MVGVLSLVACGGKHSLHGAAQKGPFALGSTLTIQELDAKLAPVGKLYSVDIEDDLGTFSIGPSITSSFVELKVQGVSYDENWDAFLDGEIHLRAIVAVGSGNSVGPVGVNTLTDLQSDRLVKLVEAGHKFDDAELQSRNEVLAAFGIQPVSDPLPPTALDISRPGDANAVLLATSASLLAAAQLENPQPNSHNNYVYLQELLARIRSEIAANGSWANATDKTELALAQTLLPRGACGQAYCQLWTGAGAQVGNVTLNLSAYYSARGVDAGVPDWIKFIDGDGNGIVDAYEDGGWKPDGG